MRHPPPPIEQPVLDQTRKRPPSKQDLSAPPRPSGSVFKVGAEGITWLIELDQGWAGRGVGCHVTDGSEATSFGGPFSFSHSGRLLRAINV